jgi:MoxR-like ATPase
VTQSAGGHGELGERTARILDEVERAVIGKRDVLELVLLGLLADGHVLIEDNPGLAKTLMARSFAAVTGLRFTRVQFTPDLMPSDVTGSAIYDQASGELRFQPGPIFTHVLLGDEINRAPPKTQAALLEAMQERQVTTEDRTRPLERPFLVLATQNPIEYEGTYPLPEAQLDRFMVRVSLGYPEADAEADMLAAHADHDRVLDLEAVADVGDVLAAQAGAAAVYGSDPLRRYIVAVLDATRADPRVELGASPRAGLMLFRAAKALAALEGRHHALPDDVQALAPSVLTHRVLLAPDSAGDDRAAVVRDALDRVPAL